MSESCSTCKFSAPSENRLADSLECRRNPPTGGGRRHLAEWPLTSADAWCGEFEVRPATASKPARKPRPATGEQEIREQG